MPLDINQFRNNLRDGGARPSLFEMRITKSGLAFPTAPFHVRVAEIPPATVTPIVQKFAGRELKFAGQRTYPNITVTVLNDEGFTIRAEMERWIDLVNGRVNNRRGGPVEDGVLTINQLAKTGGPIGIFNFVDAFPVTMSSIPLDWSNDGVIEEYTVEFAYSYYVPVTIPPITF